MQKNLLLKTVIIVATLLIFVYGMLGIPKSFNGEGLKAALLDRIHLGLDLKGGTHLILQVMVNDAVNADSDRAMERLKESLKTKGIAYNEISKPDPQTNPDRVAIKGVPPESAADLRDIINNQLPEYVLN